MFENLELFASTPISFIGHHGTLCCGSSRAQLMAALDSGAVEESLAAIPLQVKWDAVAWPVYWCDLVDGDDGFRGDCGVHAALASIVLSDHGVAHGRAQIAIGSPARHMAHWRARWDRAGVPPRWVGRVSVYHEVLAVGSRYWDPSEARWFEGAGAWLVAGRVVAVRADGETWTTWSATAEDQS